MLYNKGCLIKSSPLPCTSIQLLDTWVHLTLPTYRWANTYQRDLQGNTQNPWKIITAYCHETLIVEWACYMAISNWSILMVDCKLDVDRYFFPPQMLPQCLENLRLSIIFLGCMKMINTFVDKCCPELNRKREHVFPLWLMVPENLNTHIF